MKQMKTCSSAHFVILLTILLAGCGNKGPLVRPVATQELAPAVETADAETEQKELKK
jgi:predicted small lipoprotein YifL